MTIEELYNYAKENGIENYKIRVAYDSEEVDEDSIEIDAYRKDIVLY